MHRSHVASAGSDSSLDATGFRDATDLRCSRLMCTAERATARLIDITGDRNPGREHRSHDRFLDHEHIAAATGKPVAATVN